MRKFTRLFFKFSEDEYKKAKEHIAWVGVVSKDYATLFAILGGFIAFVFGLFFGVTKSSNVMPGDITAIFGQYDGKDRVYNKKDYDNIGNLRTLMATSQRNVKIVTINASSWIPPNLMETLKATIKRIDVTIIFFDYTDSNMLELWSSAMSEYGQDVWTVEHFKENIQIYKKLMNPESKLHIGLYNSYPWTRFVIFDDKSVSFIVTPNLNGDNVIPYFSKDPFVVKCFEEIFQEIQDNASRRGKMFQDISAFEKIMPDPIAK